MTNDGHVLIRVPASLREEFKDVAWSKKRTMSDLLREYMEAEVKNTPARPSTA
jgi:uncharacterized protein with HEPN domain